MEEYKIGLEIKKTSNLIRREMDKSIGKMQEESLVGNSGWIIGFLARNQDRDIFQKDLEQRFIMRRSTVSSMLSLMEEKGLIERVPVSYDARLKKLVLTKKALSIHHKVACEMMKMDKKLSAGLSDAELKEFFRILTKIRGNIEDNMEGDNDD